MHYKLFVGVMLLLSILGISNNILSSKSWDVEIKLNLDAENPPSYKQLFNAVDGGYFKDIRKKSTRIAIKKACDDGLKFIRIHEPIIGSQLYSVDKFGIETYNWKLWDQIFDFLIHECNLKPLIILESVPPKIAGKSTKKKWHNRLPPNDYAEWGKLVRSILIHSINRYGKEEIESWYFETWNEPDAIKYWEGDFDDCISLHKSTYSNLKNIDNKVQISTPGFCCVNRFLPKFIEKANDINYDFISWHLYCGRFGIPNLNIIYRSLGIVDSLSKRANLSQPWLITEYGMTFGKNELRDTKYNAAFLIKSAKILLSYPKFQKVYYHGIADNMMDGFIRGQNALFTNQAIPKPVYNSFRYLNKLKGKLLQLNSNSDLIDGIAVVDLTEKKIRVILTTFDKDPNSEREINVKVKINSIKYTLGSLSSEIVNRNSGNSYRKWIELGKMKNPSKNKINIIRANAIPTSSQVSEKNVQLYLDSITLKSNNVLYLEINLLEQ